MIFSLRHWIAIFAAGLGWSEAMLGQEAPTGGSASSGSSTPSSGSSSTDSGSSGSSSVFGSGSGSSSSFNVFSSEAPKTPTETTGSTGTTTQSETGVGFNTPSFSATTSRATPPSFTVPGFYGQGSTTFFGGTGRLARPRFRAGVTFGIGYDDNLYSTPSSNTPTIIPGFSQVVDSNGNTVSTQPTETKTITVQTGTKIISGGLRVPVYETFTTTVPVDTPDTVVPPQERKGSIFTRVGLSLEMQSFTPRSLFTLNSSGSASYYLDKDPDPVDYSGNFSMAYQYRVTPRLQITAQANAAYISQPDLSRPNTPDRQIQGDLINALARLDLAYRVTPRLSFSLTTNFSGNRYTEVTEQTGDYNEYTFGLEGRYLWRPRWTLLAEFRHGMTRYLNRNDLDGTTEYLLVGTEFVLGPRLSGTLRVGEAIKTFDSTGDSQSAPYVESTVSYRSTERSSVTWNNRFGFEEPQTADEERLVYRATINYTYAFTPHLQGVAGVNLVHEITTSSNTDAKTTNDTFEASLGVDYSMTRNFSINGNYTFTLSNTNTGTSDYYRDRVFLGGQYNF